jgi:hypothetical protein
VANEYTYAQLSACLALVRPVGMTEGETEDWLAVAAEAIEHIPPHILEWGAKAARQKCTHHSQVVPTIITETRDAVAWHNRPKAGPHLQLVARTPERPAAPLPDPDTIMPGLRRMGLQKGWIVEGPDGLEWSKESGR